MSDPMMIDFVAKHVESALTGLKKVDRLAKK
jgi:hypothetical protein